MRSLLPRSQKKINRIDISKTFIIKYRWTLFLVPKTVTFSNVNLFECVMI
jgi:hypothetical protein